MMPRLADESDEEEEDNGGSPVARGWRALPGSEGASPSHLERRSMA
jgi:hypothetical protein